MNFAVCILRINYFALESTMEVKSTDLPESTRVQALAPLLASYMTIDGFLHFLCLGLFICRIRLIIETYELAELAKC